MPEPILSTLESFFHKNRKFLFWSFVGLVFLLLVIQLKELTSLLLAAYLIALLLDPIVGRVQKLKLSRQKSMIVLVVLAFLFGGAILALLIPEILREYELLAKALPDYLDRVSAKIKPFVSSFIDIDKLKAYAVDGVSLIGSESLSKLSQSMSKAALSGYSFTLTLVNLALLPFFVFYILRDLNKIHASFLSFLPSENREVCKRVGGEILSHFQAFFKGQLTVSAVMAVLYVIGLSIVGLPSAVIVGILSGLLNIVPYLGLALGLGLGLMITIVSDPGWVQIVSLLAVFGVVQFLEGTILTPKIVGESVGIHPLGVIVALIAFGQLFGLFGMILAIPAAAAIRVLFAHFHKKVETESLVTVS